MADLIRDGGTFADAVKAVTGEYPIITATTIPDDVVPPVDPYAAYFAHRDGCPNCWHGHACDEGHQLLCVALEEF